MTFNSGLRTCAYLVFAAAFSTMQTGCTSQANRNGRTFTADRVPAHLQYRATANPRIQSLVGAASSPMYGNTIGPGDTVEIAISAGLGPQHTPRRYTAQVTDDGKVSISSEMGPVEIARLLPAVAGTAIQNELIDRDLYRNPLVSVRVLEKRQNTIRVIGGVNKPGIYPLPVDQADVFSAIAAAGGLADNVGDKIEVRGAVGGGGMTQETGYANNDSSSGIQQAGYSQPMAMSSFAMQPMTISLSSLAQGGMSQAGGQGYKLGDGAVIHVQERDPVPISVQGLVNKPGPIPDTGNPVRLMDALAHAAGVSNQFANKYRVIRQAQQGPPINIIGMITEAKEDERHNMVLAPGDVVYVEQTPGTFVLDALRIIRFGVSSRLDQLL